MRADRHLFLVAIGLCLAAVFWLAGSGGATRRERSGFSASVDTNSILKVTSAVADWQLAHPSGRPHWDWTEGALWTGLLAHAHSTGDDKYLDALKKVSENLGHRLGPRRGMGDDHVVGQLHLWHYLRDELRRQLGPTRDVLQAFVSRPHDESLLWVNQIHEREWAWCDSLYMVPPTLAALHAATGDRRFLDVMDRLFWKTTDYLYDRESSLYWRDSRYFGQKEANGEKVFWSRGNGWVFAGLCHVLQHMPEDYAARPRYVKLFLEMAAKLKSLQQPDGSWRSSLLNPDAAGAPESSGTAFFTYGFLWGINNGILPEAEYKPAALKGWQRLVKSVHPDGKLGFVQKIADKPDSATFDETAPYGVGGFLQAGHELHKHLILSGSTIATLTASNPSEQVRLNEVVQVDWELVRSKLPKAGARNVGVRDAVRGYFVPTQVIDRDRNGSPDALLFRADLAPKERRRFQLCAFGKHKPRFRPNQMTARFVPERKDDFAWENDRIAYRAYGPALARESARGGIDVWTKSVRTPIVNEWYRKGSAHYHSDHGTGLDGYKVGDTLGCGGLGYLSADGRLVTSPVFAKSRVLENGPLRLKFELRYPPLKIDQATVSEVRTITMTTGEHHFEVQSRFKVVGDATGIRPVAGLALRDPKHKAAAFGGGFLGYWDNIMAREHGHIGTFILNDDSAHESYERKDGHLLKVLARDLARPVRYRAGAVWQKVDAPDAAAFENRLFRMNHETRHPIRVD
ncbi:MAG: glycoside hydrolase family 88 protein [Proteobacteria bacterium]|nr:glycoside hydrolase family 88 protein [Pseudomonadota bacterium]